jgi:hypothetical protein
MPPSVSRSKICRAMICPAMICRSIIRRAILKQFLLVVSCTLAAWAITPLASAQRAIGNTSRAVHTSAPAMPHISHSAAPVIHVYAPISASRISSASSAGMAGFRPHRPIRPFPPVLVLYDPFLFGGPFWGLNSCWSATCSLFWPWTFGAFTISSPGPTNYSPELYETPAYVYGEVYGEESPDLPQLFLKDGTVLNVNDYWLVDDQLHFTIIDEDGAQPTEHVIPFEALDLQKTVDANTRRGFRFVLRNEPVEQYLRDHPEGPPPLTTPPHE